MQNKILQILPQEEFFSPHNGGAIATWVKGFSSDFEEYQTTVFVPYSKRRISGVISFGARIKLFKVLGGIIPGKIGHHLVYNTYVIWSGLFARLHHFHIIHIHNRPTYIPIIKRINPKAKVILHMHNDHVLDLNKRQLQQLHHYSDHIISVSQYIQKGIVKKGLQYSIELKAKCTVLLNGCNDNQFQKQVPANNDNILFVGRLTPEKGIKELIEATIKVKGQVPKIKLLVAGSSGFGKLNDTSFVQDIKKLAEKGNGCISFLGYVEHDKVPDLFQQVALYCIPSIWNDPCPLAVMEGMASGIPMIVGNKGGIPEQVGDTALKVNCEDAGKLANAMAYALTHKDEMRQMANKAYNRFLNNLTWSHVQTNYTSIINKL